MGELVHCAFWMAVGLLCVFAGSEPTPSKGRYMSVRDVYFPPIKHSEEPT